MYYKQLLSSGVVDSAVVATFFAIVEEGLKCEPYREKFCLRMPYSLFIVKIPWPALFRVYQWGHKNDNDTKGSTPLAHGEHTEISKTVSKTGSKETPTYTPRSLYGKYWQVRKAGGAVGIPKRHQGNFKGTYQGLRHLQVGDVRGSARRSKCPISNKERKIHFDLFKK